MSLEYPSQWHDVTIEPHSEDFGMQGSRMNPQDMQHIDLWNLIAGHPDTTSMHERNLKTVKLKPSIHRYPGLQILQQQFLITFLATEPSTILNEKLMSITACLRGRNSSTHGLQFHWWSSSTPLSQLCQHSQSISLAGNLLTAPSVDLAGDMHLRDPHARTKYI